jgi:hypothetical protein
MYREEEYIVLTCRRLSPYMLHITRDVIAPRAGGPLISRTETLDFESRRSAW